MGSDLVKLAASLAVYIGAIVAANIMTAHLGLVPAGFGLMVTAGTYAAGFALLARDFVQRFGGLVWVAVAIGIGAVLSWIYATPTLAVASTVAFTLAEVADLLVYTRLRDRGFVRAALASNIVGAPVDTLVFLWLAGFPITVEVVAGQLVAKLLWATVVPLALYAIGRHALLRDPVRPKGV